MVVARPTVPRVLLLTGTAPAPDGVGGIILDDLCRFLPSDRLVVAHVVDRGGSVRDVPNSNGAPWRNIPLHFQRRPESKWGRLGRVLSWPGMSLRNHRAIRRAAEATVSFAREHGVREIWAVLDGPSTTELAVPVARRLGVPLRVMVWDDVEHNVRYFGLDSWTARRVKKRFAQTVRSAARCAVIGETMQAEYSRRYAQHGVIVRHGTDPSTPQVAATEPGPAIRIGFAGSVTARSAFDKLLATLDQLGWEVGGRPVTLVLMGGRFDLWSKVPRRIECLGWQPVDLTIQILAGCTLNYLPQPFESDWRSFSELSFPSKLTTYLAARVPILLHSPTYASLPRFFADHRFGVLCTELDTTRLGEALQSIALNPDVRANAVSASELALAQEFSTQRFRTSFAEFLDLQLESLHA